MADERWFDVCLTMLTFKTLSTGCILIFAMYKYFNTIQRLWLAVRFRSTESSSLLVVTDVGDEIDDELGLLELFCHSRNSLDIKLLITTGDTQLRVESFWSTFEEFFLDGSFVLVSPSSFYVVRRRKPLHRVCLYVGDNTQRKINRVVKCRGPLVAEHIRFLKHESFQVVVVMAPLDGLSGDVFNQLSLDTVIVVGNLMSTNTSATAGVETFLPLWRAIRKATKGRIIFLDPALMQQIPLSQNYLQKLPISLANAVKKLAFDFLVHRPAGFSPALQKSINAANALTAKSYWYDVTGSEIPNVTDGKFLRQAQNYCSRYCPGDTQTVKNIALILMVVFKLTGQMHTDEDLRNLPDMQGAFAQFQEACGKIKAFTPAYDLIGIKLALCLVEGRSEFWSLLNPQLQTVEDEETDLLKIAADNCYLCKDVSQQCVEELIQFL